MRELAHANAVCARDLNKRAHDRGKRQVSYAVGDHVLVRAGNWKRSKLDSEGDGPARIVKKIHDLSNEVHDPVMQRTTQQHVNNLRPFDMSRSTPEAEQLRLLDADVYVVKSILAHRSRGHHLDVLVKYKGYEDPEWQDITPLRQVDVFKTYVVAHGLEQLVWLATSSAQAARKARRQASA